MSLNAHGGPVVDTSHSPYALHKALPTTSVRFTDSFWNPRTEVNRKVTLPSQYKLLWDTGRMRNFQRAAGKVDVPFEGIYFNDSDVYKWLEAASFAIADEPGDTALTSMVDECIAEISAAQDSNGYLNTYFSVDRVAERWTNFDLHELYCAGHLFQAAVAHYRATGKTSLLDVGRRLADHIVQTFGPKETGRREAVCGHEEIEMALVELARATGEPKYLAQARFFVDYRGRNLSGSGEYSQDHVPIREMKDVTGHAVRAMYLECAGADVYLETGEKALLDALETQWKSLTMRKMYVTGGAGSRWAFEAFGWDYELPSDTAYTETCAAIGSLMWNWRMLLATGEIRYADILERTLYNGVISGLSLDGKEYYYQNPLANDGKHRRQEWFGCACCPPNIARLLASLTGYVATVTGDSLWLHLYAACTIDAALPDGRRIALEVETRYPWDGDITLKVVEAPAGPFTLRLRIPDWAEGSTVVATGNNVAAAPGEYAAITQTLKPGDTVRVTLPMQVRRIESNPAVNATSGRISLTRGPLVYCIEQADHPAVDIRSLRLPAGSTLNARWAGDILGGVVAIEGEAVDVGLGSWSDGLYRAINRCHVKAVPFAAIPYYAWANREPGPMTVWIPEG